ncbi:MAG: acyl-CoA dehydrogenase [Longimicrobiales bacterium]
MKNEAVRALAPTGAAARAEPAEQALDPAAMHRFIDGDHLDIRARLFDLLSRPEFQRGRPETHHAYRDRVLRWCKRLADEGIGAIAYPREFGGENDVARSIAAFETIAFHDISLLAEFGVQFGLFAGSIYQLGTRKHHERYLRAALRLELPGCFAMTETGHGSNVRELETMATYDTARHEFVIDSPSAQAQKDYIGNAAAHATMAVVFAQLRTHGETHGVHAFMVPIRDAAGRPVAGVRIEDCGVKQGLNGVDNGRITFDAVRVPRDNLLDRFGAVAQSGTYTSPIASPSRRFFTMIGALVAGRVAVAAAATNASKSGLAIAIRYANDRRQFGPDGKTEVPILDYLAVQRRLLPRLALTVALDLTIEDLVRRFSTRSDAEAREIETHAAALKALSSWHTIETLQTCRETCGGQGYLAINRIPTLKADADVFTTFEGDNTVLLQLVARSMLTEYRESFGELQLWGVVKHLASRAATAISGLNPIVTRRTDTEHLRDVDFLASALRYREDRLLSSLARRLRYRIEHGVDPFAALNECQDHALALGRAHAERMTIDGFAARLAKSEPSLRPVLRNLASLAGLWLIERDRAWFLEAGVLEAPKARAIRAQVNRLCAELRPHAVALADGFGIPDALLGAPIAVHE